eukprot:jgi/Mesvir1/26378/Mv23108-RA.1
MTLTKTNGDGTHTGVRGTRGHHPVPPRRAPIVREAHEPAGALDGRRQGLPAELPGEQAPGAGRRGSGGHGFSGADPSADSEMVMEASLGVRFHRGYLASARSLCEHLLTHPSMVKRGGGWQWTSRAAATGGRWA